MSLYEEMGVAGQVIAANAELRRLRIETMGYTYVNSEGNVVVQSCPELTAIQGKITDIETKLAAVAGIKDEISGLLVGYDSIRSLKTAKERYANTIQSCPVRAWDLFRMKKELAIEQGDATVRVAMPSELPAALSGYQVQEDAIKAELTAAQAAITTVSEALESIADLIEQAKVALA